MAGKSVCAGALAGENQTIEGLFVAEDAEQNCLYNEYRFYCFCSAQLVSAWCHLLKLISNFISLLPWVPASFHPAFL